MRMKKGDLVKLKNVIHHVSGIYKPGLIGVVLKVKGPSPRDPSAVIEVHLGENVIACYWHELELLNESR